MIRQNSHLWFKKNWIFDCNIWNQYFDNLKENMININNEMLNIDMNIDKILEISEKLTKIYGGIKDMNSKRV